MFGGADHETALVGIPKGESLVGVICIVQSSRGGGALCAKSLRDSTQINILLVSSLPGCCWVAHTHFGIRHAGPARANTSIGILQLCITEMYNDPIE